MFPAWLQDDGFDINGTDSQHRPNLSLSAQHYLDSMGAGVEDLFHHVIAMLHDPGVPRQLYLPVGVNQFCRFTSLAWPRCWAALVR